MRKPVWWVKFWLTSGRADYLRTALVNLVRVVRPPAEVQRVMRRPDSITDAEVRAHFKARSLGKLSEAEIIEFENRLRGLK